MLLQMADSWTSHDHLLCRSRDHWFLGTTKDLLRLFEDAIGEPLSACTRIIILHVEVKLAKGWVDPRPWVRGCEPELSSFDQAVSKASVRKRRVESCEGWRDSVAEVRRCKRPRLAWLRSKEVEWRDAKAQQVQDKVDHREPFGFFFSEGPKWGQTKRDAKLRNSRVPFCSIPIRASPVFATFKEPRACAIAGLLCLWEKFVLQMFRLNGMLVRLWNETAPENLKISGESNRRALNPVFLNLFFEYG